MKIKCSKCGKRLESEICRKCGFNNSLYYRIEKFSRPSRRGIIISLVTAVTVIIGLYASCVSCTACPEVWSVSAKKNRAAILEYANKNYPEAKIVEEYYPSAEFNPTNKPYDSIMFDFNGVNFFIWARDGEVNEKNDDGYGAAIIRQEIREKYLDDFFHQLNIPYSVQINFSEYWPQKDDTLASFKGTIRLEFELEYDDSKSSTQDFDWFYDFYCYWSDICPTQGFTLRFYYWTDSEEKYVIHCDSSSKFDSKEEFYGVSERLPV